MSRGILEFRPQNEVVQPINNPINNLFTALVNFIDSELETRVSKQVEKRLSEINFQSKRSNKNRKKEYWSKPKMLQNISNLPKARSTIWRTVEKFPAQSTSAEKEHSGVLILKRLSQL